MTQAPARPTAWRTRFHPLRISRVDLLTDDAAAISFEVPPGTADFDFAAGEALTLRRILGGIEHRRSYSICAPVGEPPRIGVREIPGGLFSSWLVREARPGDVVEVQPPSGSFRADPAVPARHLCIAAGSGITPLLSITASVLANPAATVTLLYGNRTAASVMFAEELADLKDAHGDRFELVHVLSREPREVELFSGRLDAERVRAICTSLVPLADVDHVWLCGPLGMIEDARKVLAELDVPADRVHVELFYVDGPPPQLRHPEAVVEGATSEATVVLDGRSTTGSVRRDRTLLDSAQGLRGDVPFACKGAVCGTCRARVGGEVDMVRNYALEPEEVVAGFVLTCQTFPVGDQVTVDYDA